MKRILIICGLCLAVFSTEIFAQSLSSLYEKTNPAVVTILVKEKQLVGKGPKKQTVLAGGLGSGFLIDNRHVVTASHVVQTAEDILIQIDIGEEIPAKVISNYKNADVALLELTWPTQEKTFLEFADSEEVKIGDQIFVIGAPFGLDHSLSSGYISNKMGSSKLSNAFTKIEYFQTDASINHGNSGGPMMNMDGKVVGIVSYILSQSGGFEGLGFASTSNVANDLLLKRQDFYLGFDSDYLVGDMSRMLNVPQPEALIVKKVVDLSPAGMMGLRGGIYEAQIDGNSLTLGGDIILAVNDIEIAESNLGPLSDLFGNLTAGQKVDFKILRAGEIKTLSWTVTGK